VELKGKAPQANSVPDSSVASVLMDLYTPVSCLGQRHH
jgi:hypothetical protein